MIPEYAAIYRDLYERHWWWRAREAMLLEEIERHRPAEGWRRILDVGCGDGLFFSRLEQLGEVWGVESDATLVPADSRHRSRIHVGPFDAGYPPGRRFDLVLMLDVLEHLADPVGALRRAAELFEPGGRLLITVPAFQVLWTTHDDLNLHFVRYRQRTLNAVAERAGLRVLSQRYFFHWLFPVKLGVRALEQLGYRVHSPAAIPQPTLNGLLLRLSRAEQATVGRLGLPFG
ncbi:MAG: class I SAM-dependent methyltransferase [Acidimicrobiales bacterium]